MIIFDLINKSRKSGQKICPDFTILVIKFEEVKNKSEL